jgi:hypothetical protein
LFVHSSLNTWHSSPILHFFGGFMVSLKLEIYIFTVAKTKLKLTRWTRKALRMRTYTAHAYWRGRPSGKYETNLWSHTWRKSRFKADFSDCLGGPQKKTLSGPHVARGPLFAHPWSIAMNTMAGQIISAECGEHRIIGRISL